MRNFSISSLVVFGFHQLWKMICDKTEKTAFGDIENIQIPYSFLEKDSRS